MRILFGVSLTGIALLWGWALYWPKPPGELPERFVGEFVLVRYVPASRADQDPPIPGQTKHFYFRADGTYKVRIMVSGGYEMWRQEGAVEVRDGLLVLTQVSKNREESRSEHPHRFKASWGQDKGGEFLGLKEVDRGYELVLRRIPDNRQPTTDNR